MKGRGFARRVTVENFQDFKALLTTQSENTESEGDVPTSSPPSTADPALVAVEKLFAGDSLRVGVPFHRARITTKPYAKTAAPRTTRRTVGELLWSMTLAASDVQRQKGHGTGGMRLVQADLRGKIDHTTFFRQDVFGGFSWTEVRQSPFGEETTVAFDIQVDGKSLGVHRLVVGHKPSEEANQGNQTTILRWSGLTQEIRKLDLTGKKLRLYGPSDGTEQPYFIEID